MNTKDIKLPPSSEVRRKIVLCKTEAAELKRLLRACESAEKAEDAHNDRLKIEREARQ